MLWFGWPLPRAAPRGRRFPWAPPAAHLVLIGVGTHLLLIRSSGAYKWGFLRRSGRGIIALFGMALATWVPEPECYLTLVLCLWDYQRLFLSPECVSWPGSFSRTPKGFDKYSRLLPGPRVFLASPKLLPRSRGLLIITTYVPEPFSLGSVFLS